MKAALLEESRSFLCKEYLNSLHSGSIPGRVFVTCKVRFYEEDNKVVELYYFLINLLNAVQVWHRKC